MFESASLGRSYPAKEYAALESELRMKLFKAQGTCICILYTSDRYRRMTV